MAAVTFTASPHPSSPLPLPHSIHTALSSSSLSPESDPEMSPEPPECAKVASVPTVLLHRPPQAPVGCSPCPSLPVRTTGVAINVKGPQAPGSSGLATRLMSLLEFYSVHHVLLGQGCYGSSGLKCTRVCTHIYAYAVYSTHTCMYKSLHKHRCAWCHSPLKEGSPVCFALEQSVRRFTPCPQAQPRGFQLRPHTHLSTSK